MPGSKWEQVFLENAGPVDEGFQLLALEKAFGADAKEHRRGRLLLCQFPQAIDADAGIGGGFFKRQSRFFPHGNEWFCFGYYKAPFRSKNLFRLCMFYCFRTYSPMALAPVSLYRKDCTVLP